MRFGIGIRKIEWSNKGLFINGKETLLRGGCVHHDSVTLGAATYAESEERRVRILSRPRRPERPRFAQMFFLMHKRRAGSTKTYLLP